MNTSRLADIISDPTVLAELQKCASVNELVERLNRAGVACTREEGLRFLRAWESVAADNESMAEEEPDRVAGGTGGVKSFLRSVFAGENTRWGRRASCRATARAILSRMNR